MSVLALALLAQSALGAEQPGCEDFAEVRSGAVTFQNNVWQREDVTGTQCLTGDGWRWDWPSVEPPKVRSFPAAYFGQRPWQQKSTLGALPIRLSDLNSLVVDYEISSTQTAISNTAIDTWITSTSSSSDGSDITAELMIWLSHAPEFSPGAESSGEAEIDGQTYDLYLTELSPVVRANFVARDYIPKGSVSIGKFVDALAENAPVDKKNYLRSVELGNEIVSGKGETKIAGFSIHVNE